MGLLVGKYEILLDKKRYLRIPSKFVAELELPEQGKVTSYPLIVAPTDEFIVMLPFNCYKRSPARKWLHDVAWGSEIRQLVSENRVNACPPFYRTDMVSDKVRQAVQILAGEEKKNPETIQNLSGKDFERLLYEILNSLGINVQLNVRLLGTEIDLLLLELNEQGQIAFTIIECKHRGISRKAVGISQVMRVYGLREALKKDFTVKNAIIVTTTDFSPQARQFAQVYKLNLVDYEGFIEWATTHRLIADSKHYPLFRLVNLDQRGRFYAPTWLTSYLKNSDRWFTFVGLGDYMELWNRQTLQSYLSYLDTLVHNCLEYTKDILEI